MKNTPIIVKLKLVSLCAAATAVCATGWAQQTAYWTNILGGTWNTPANWNVDNLGINAVPGVGTNADLSSQIASYTDPTVVNYDTAMTAASIGALFVGNSGTTNTVLNINAPGFNINLGGLTTAAITVGSGSVLNVNSGGVLTTTNGGTASLVSGVSGVSGGGVMSVSGIANLSAVTDIATNAALSLDIGSILSVESGGSVNVFRSSAITLDVDSALNINGGTFTMTDSAESTSLNVGPNNRNNGATLTINDGTLSLDGSLAIRGGSSGGNLPASTLTLNGGLLNSDGCEILNGQDDAITRLIVDNGGVANLGDFSVERTSPGGGLILSNGVVNTTSMRIGTGVAAAASTIYGGILTNTGLLTIADRNNAADSKNRRVYLYIRGGQVYCTGSEGIVINNQAEGDTANLSNIGGTLEVSGGLLSAEQIYLNGPNVFSNAYARLEISGGEVYLGSGGLVTNAGDANLTAVVTLTGGILGAKADWSSSANMSLSSDMTLKAADAGDAGHNITLAGVLSGTGALKKTGAGMLTLAGANTYNGATSIGEGTLAIAAGGAIDNSPTISLAAGTVFDVSAAPGFSLTGSQALSGDGTVAGALTAPPGTSIRPGGLGTAGALAFASDLTESGGAVNNFDLSDDPTGTVKTNDLITVGGNLNLDGVNTIQVHALNGSLALGLYPLIHYTGNFNGTLTNLSLSGAIGTLTNDTGAKTIGVIVESTTRAPTDITWVGNPSANDWDVLNHTNWLNGGALDYFVPGDNARFNDTGAANPLVNITANVTPSSVVVDSTANYSFTGAGGIAGFGGLIKTNSGTLTVATTNSYVGATVLSGGTLEVAQVANGGTPSGIGAAASDPANLVFDGGALRYTGPSATTDHGVTANADAAVDVANSSTLTVSGTVTGAGGLTKAGPGTLTLSSANSYAGETTITGGTLQINAQGGLGTNALNLGGGTLFINIGGQPTIGNPMNLLAESGINVASRNTIWLADNWSGTNTLNVNVDSGGYFTISSEISSNFVGTINLGTSAGTFRLNSGGSDPCIGSTNVTFDLGTGSALFVNRNGSRYGTTTYYLGGLAGGPNTMVRGAANTGTPNTYEIGDNNLDTTFGGIIADGAGGSGAVVSVLKAGTGTLTLSGTNTYTGDTTITNGVLAISGDGTIAGSPNIHLIPGAELDFSGRTDGTLVLSTNQILDGGGPILGSLTVGEGATVSPGDANYVFDSNIDQFTVTNAFVMQPGSTLTMDVDIYTPTNDMIYARSIVYGGTLNLLGTVTGLNVGDSFKLFNAESYSGAFDAINPPNPNYDSNFAWDTSTLTTDGRLRVGLPRPKMYFELSGSDLVFSVSNGVPFSSYAVLTSTNLALPLSQWTSVVTNTLDFAGGSSFTNSVDRNRPQLYYLLQTVQP